MTADCLCVWMCTCAQRDGMNLVSYEYVACQSDNAGVLVLSEFAGEQCSAVRT